MLAIRAADHRCAVALIHIKNPVLAPRHPWHQLGEPIVELDPQLVGVPRLLDVRMSFGAQPFVTHGAAAVEDAEATIEPEIVVRFGLLAAGLVAHR